MALDPRAPHPLVVNGKACTVEAAPLTTLLEVLRGDLGLKGTKEACGRGECGACTVFVGNATVNACTTLARRVTAPVETIEGIAEREGDLREAFADHGAFQCGFCTPGMVVRAAWLLANFEGPWTRPAIRRELAGNICRCTGYQGIVDAILVVHAARAADARARPAHPITVNEARS
jgi:aerobic-type carbon monoxide dehydrogenase small subunit (CoxS/CutS family)